MENDVKQTDGKTEVGRAETGKAETGLVAYKPPATSIVRGRALLDGMAIESLAEACWKSGMFKDIRSAFQAIVKIKVGMELGIPPMQAMSGVYIIEGKTCLAATLMGALIKASGRYNYRIQQLDDNGCAIAFYERDDDGKWVSVGPSSTFTMADANKAGVAGKGVWKAWPRNMLFARAMSNGARWYCADVFLGPVYVPEELGAEVNGEGELVYDVKPENVRTDNVSTDNPVMPQEVPQAIPSQVPLATPQTPPNLVRNDWQREAAKTIYTRVAPEVVEQIKATAGNPLFDEAEFTRYLVGIAKDHVITLPGGIRPIDALYDPDQQPLFDENGELTAVLVGESEVIHE